MSAIPPWPSVSCPKSWQLPYKHGDKGYVMAGTLAGMGTGAAACMWLIHLPQSVLVRRPPKPCYSPLDPLNAMSTSPLDRIWPWFRTRNYKKLDLSWQKSIVLVAAMKSPIWSINPADKSWHRVPERKMPRSHWVFARGQELVPPCRDNCYPADHELMSVEIGECAEQG